VDIRLRCITFLRANLLCDGRSIPLLSTVVPSEKQNNSLIQNDSLAHSLPPDARGIIVMDAGFQSALFLHIALYEPIPFARHPLF